MNTECHTCIYDYSLCKADSCKHGRSTETTEVQCVFSMLQYNKGHIQHMQRPIFAFEK